MADSKCLYCDMLLTRTEREEGWCDSCGKRLPASEAPRSAPRYNGGGASAPQGGSRVGRFFAVFALALVFGLLGAVVSAVLTGGHGGHYGGMAGAGVGSAIARGFMRKRSG